MSLPGCMARTSEFSCAQAAGSVQSFCVQTDKLLGIHSHCLKNNTHRISLKAGLEKINAKKPPKAINFFLVKCFWSLQCYPGRTVLQMNTEERKLAIFCEVNLDSVGVL